MMQRLILEGHYRGKNLFVENPQNKNGTGFCITKVTVNGLDVASSVASSAFEINFSKLGLQPGDPITILINHGDGCTPKVINPGAI